MNAEPATLSEVQGLAADLRLWLAVARGDHAWLPTAAPPELPPPPILGPMPRSAAAPRAVASPPPQRATPAPVAAQARPSTVVPPAADSWRTQLRGEGRSSAVGGPPAPAPRAPALARDEGPPPPDAGRAPVSGARESFDPHAAKTLSELRAALQDCSRCALAGGRSQVVFGVGPDTADLMFVGEGPGYHEDRLGEPFVGDAGQLLDQIVERVLRLSRPEVYIANVVKCRPPNNRNPEPLEIAACSPFLLRQIELVRPKVIVALGKFAAQVLLDSRAPISSLRGSVHSFGDAALIPTFHPAYLLRNPQDKKFTMEDMKLVRAELERRTGRALPPPLRRSDVEGAR